MIDIYLFLAWKQQSISPLQLQTQVWDSYKPAKWVIWKSYIQSIDYTLMWAISLKLQYFPPHTGLR